LLAIQNVYNSKFKNIFGLMEFKIIIYIIIGIAWYVINNYKKIAEENRKRVFGKPVIYPPTEQPQPNSPAPVKEPIVVKTIKEKPVIKKRSLPQNTLINKTRKPITVPEIYNVDSTVLTANSIQVPVNEDLEKKYFNDVIQNRELLKKAIVFGDLINKPLWAKY